MGMTSILCALIAGGNAWLHKDGQWQKGSISESKIAWETPQGICMRRGRISGHKVSRKGKKLYILDE